MNIDEKLEDLQNLIGLKFADTANLRSAISHSSFVNELKVNKWEDYERLEFLGDAVLEIVSSDFLYRRHPDMPEGDLSKLRASLVCEPSLAFTAKRMNLSDSVIETLSIIAYKQPVTRLEVESIRGVSCDHAIDKLLEFDLIEELGRKDAPGRPILFGTTEQFLRSFGVGSLKDLPELNTVQIEEFKQEAEQEVSTSLKI